MKLFKNMRNRPRWTSARGFTLAEMLVTVGVFLFIFTGIWIGVQVFGLRIYTLAATKLVATAGGRQALNQIRDQIREGKTVYVGNSHSVGVNSFQRITNTQPQQGNALIVYTTTNLANFVVYYLDTSTGTNCLVQYNVASNNIITFTNTLTKYVTNQIVFDVRDWQNNLITNDQVLDNRLLMGVTLQFSQWEYPLAFVGGVGLNAYDYYQLRTRVFRRAYN